MPDYKNLNGEELTPEEYNILRNKATELAFTGEYNSYKGDGDFNCRYCGNKLFKASEKFDSGSGWPSFWAPASEEAVGEVADRSHGMLRTEVVCASCQSHLGHSFPDGPKPTGIRYCINSASIKLEKKL